MTHEINYFQKIIKHKYPILWDRITINVIAQSNYHQFCDIDGRMRAELNYNLPVKYDIDVSFPNIGDLYYDLSFFIKFVWGDNLNVVASFDSFGKNYIRFTL